jgi:hypothetical protein
MKSTKKLYLDMVKYYLLSAMEGLENKKVDDPKEIINTFVDKVKVSTSYI